MSEATGKIDPAIVLKLQEKMNNLQTAQQVSDPNISAYLKEVHTLVMTYPETVWILKDDEMQSIVKAAEHNADLAIIAERAKATKKTSGRSLKNATADDF